MATASTFNIASNLKPDFAIDGMSNASLKEAANQLQINHSTSVFFNERGFHNHTAHYILSALALGGDADLIKKHGEHSEHMKKPLPPQDAAIIAGFANDEAFMAGMGNRENYSNYLEFFHQQLAKKPWQDVLLEYVFSENEKAKTMFNRLYSSVIHPFIHLGAAVEFEQPALMAEALAWTAVHESWMDPIFIETAKAVAASTGPVDSLENILDEMSEDQVLRSAPNASQEDAKRDGIIAKALAPLVRHTSKWRVSPDDVERAAAQVTDAAMYAMAGARNPQKSVKFDFFIMHSVTSTIAMWTLIRQPWITAAKKAQIIEWKGWTDLTEFASRGSPKLSLKDVNDSKITRDWNQLAYASIEDYTLDGHGHKMTRAIMHGAKVCAPYESSDNARIKGDMWLKLGNLAVDSFKDGQEMFVFGTGFPEAWAQFRDRD